MSEHPPKKRDNLDHGTYKCPGQEVRINGDRITGSFHRPRNFWLVVEPSQFNNIMLVKLDHFPRDQGENKKCFKPPTLLWEGTGMSQEFSKWLVTGSFHLPINGIY